MRLTFWHQGCEFRAQEVALQVKLISNPADRHQIGDDVSNDKEEGWARRGGAGTLHREELEGAGPVGYGRHPAQLGEGELAAAVQHLARPGVLGQPLVAVVVLQGHPEDWRYLEAHRRRLCPYSVFPRPSNGSQHHFVALHCGQQMDQDTELPQLHPKMNIVQSCLGSPSQSKGVLCQLRINPPLGKLYLLYIFL